MPIRHLNLFFLLSIDDSKKAKLACIFERLSELVYIASEHNLAYALYFFFRNYYLNKALALFLDEAKYGLHVGLMLTIVFKKKNTEFPTRSNFYKAKK